MAHQIYILHTGGTIGMQPSDTGFRPVAGFARHIEPIIAASPLTANIEVTIEEFEPLVDSSNILPQDWVAIAQRIQENYHRYDGFVVLHGTDTLAYTSSALSFLLRDVTAQGLDKPVILTGSQIPLLSAGSDAADNLCHAIKLASLAIPEVAICFADRLLRGNRSSKLKTKQFSAFDSPNYPWLAHFNPDIAVDRAATLRADSALPAQDLTTELASSLSSELPVYGRQQIVPLRIYPGITANVVEALLSANIDGLILQSYGAGNAPEQNQPLMQALAQASQHMPVINISQCPWDGIDSHCYASGSALAATGVIDGKDMTLEAAFCKLTHLLATGASRTEITHEFSRSWCGEVSV